MLNFGVVKRLIWVDSLSSLQERTGLYFCIMGLIDSFICQLGLSEQMYYVCYYASFPMVFWERSGINYYLNSVFLYVYSMLSVFIVIL